MHFILVTFCLSFLHSVRSAPAISSVHVSFVSGNKATEYTNKIGGSSPLVHYNLIDRPFGKREILDEIEDAQLRRKRSIFPHGSPRSTSDLNPTLEPITTTIFPFGTSRAPNIYKKKKFLSPKFMRKHFITTTITSNTDESASTPTTTTMTNDSETQPYTDDPTITTTNVSPLMKRMLGAHVKFVESHPRPTTAALGKNKVTMSEGNLLSEFSSTMSDILQSESKKPKDTKAVKRSPYLGENFDSGGIQFPDFDEFGGEGFGSLRNFAGHGGGGRDDGAHTHANPESLSPDGVFLPPLPTEASDYADSDPYLADPDTAKYAAQHPPFFAAFPHKRSVLALNEQRVHNGLEPNILRSIRPYFAFFDAAKPYTQGHIYEHTIPYHDVEFEYDHEHRPPRPHLPLAGPPPPPPPPISYSHSESSSDLFDRLDATHLLYAESDILRTQPILKSWSIFSKKK